MATRPRPTSAVRFERIPAVLRPLPVLALVGLVVAAGLVAFLAQSAAAATPTYDPHDAVKPIVSYDFDGDHGTTVVDTSGHGNDGTWVNGQAGGGVVPNYSPGISGKAAHVSGNKNVIQLPLKAGKTDGSGSFSFEFWYFQNSATSDSAVIASANTASCNNPGFSYYNTSASDSSLRACWGLTPGGTKEYLPASTGAVNGSWHHLAAVVDRSKGTVTTYQDGAPVATSTSITASTVLAAYPFTLGSEGSLTDDGDGSVDALLDDVNFYDAAIPAAQVAADYAATKPAVGPSYTVAFDGNGATGGSTPSQTLNVGLAQGLTKNGFTREGYSFGGWARSAGGPIAYTDAQSVTDLTKTGGATVTLHAVWNRYRAAGDTVAPIISYDFENDSGTSVLDGSGSGYDGTWTGTPSYTAGVSGKAAYVNSPDGSAKGVNYLSLPLIPGRTDGSSSFSYVFWLNEASTSADSPIVSNQDFTHCYNRGTTLYNTANRAGVLRACFGRDGTSTNQNYLQTISTQSVIGHWHQVAVVVDRDAGTMTGYLDGKQTSRSTSLSSAYSLDSGFPFRIGSDGSTTDTIDGFVNASIDDFDFYDRPISVAQVQNDYKATAPAPTVASDGETVTKGFVTDTFRAPQVRAGGAFVQPIAGLWNGAAITSYTKVGGDDWLNVDANGTVSGTAPSDAPADPATITVTATDGTRTSRLTVEVPVIAAKDAPQLAVATWNLWDAGAHVSDAQLKDLAVIAANGLDIIGVQSDGGTLATALARALGWYAYEGPGGTGVISAYPLTGASTPKQVAGSVDSPAAAVTANVLGRHVRVWSTGLDRTGYGPDTACVGGVNTPDRLVAAEKGSVRFAQAKAVASALAPDVASASSTPVIVLADLESPSFSDWTAKTTQAHCGAGAVDWPVPALFTQMGLKDSFRVAHADPSAEAGNTWSPIVKAQASGAPESQDRIDYVDFAGDSLTVLGSNTLVAGWPSAKNVITQAWTSNHRAVVTTFSLGQPTSGSGSGTGPSSTPSVAPSAAPGHPKPAAGRGAGGLANTGSDLWVPGGIAIALIAGGLGWFAVGRRRASRRVKSRVTV